MTLEKGYTITVPPMESTDIAIRFTSSMPNGLWIFDFIYNAGNWSGWVTLPEGDIRTFSPKPNVINWIFHRDYSIVLQTDDPAITASNFAGQKIGVIKWKI